MTALKEDVTILGVIGLTTIRCTVSYDLVGSDTGIRTTIGRGITFHHATGIIIIRKAANLNVILLLIQRLSSSTFG